MVSASIVTAVPRRALYRRSKRVLSHLLARTRSVPRSAVERAARRFLRAKSTRMLARLVGDRAFALAVVASLSAAGAAAALPPVNLSDVAAGSGGFVINGIDPFDFSGLSVSGAGDINGDGLDDVVVGSLGDPAGNNRAGESYVVFSPACRFDCDGVVSVTDLLALLAQYDDMSPVKCTGGSCDYNEDDCVDVLDLLTLLAQFDPAAIDCP